MHKWAYVFKVILVAALSIVLLAPATLLWVQHKMELNAHRKSVKHHLLSQTSKQDLAYFAFSNKEAEALNWKHAKEFNYQGAMYDVVQRRQTADSLLLWCWLDSDETLLYKKFESLLAENPFSPHPKPQQSKLWQNFSKMLIAKPLTFVLAVSRQAKMNGTPYHFSLKTTVLNLENPPPQFS
jgi:hypothetical protein